MKPNPEYLPAGKTIRVAMPPDLDWNRGYAGWFDEMRMLRRHLTFACKNALVYTLRRCLERVVDQEPVVWVLFDLANGDKRTHRYAWVFPTVEEAAEHAARQRENPHGAALSTPKRYFRMTDVKFFLPASKAKTQYCLKNPDGILFPETISTDKRGLLSNSFELIAEWHAGWRDRYWKKNRAFVRAARDAGWSAVPVRVEEIKEGTLP